jgi:hypothetical protein
MGMLLLSSLHLGAQQKPAIVNLTVVHNGHQQPAPAEIKVSFNGRVLRIPVRGGKFEASPELIAAQRVTLEAEIEGSHIRLTKIAGTDFTEGNWTLRLAEQANNDYYEWPGPKNAKISATCMLEFDSGHEDPARVLFEQRCRSKAH